MGTEGPTPLSELLNEPEEQTEAPDVEIAPEPEPSEADQPRDEHGRFAKKGEEESASPAPDGGSAFEGAATIGERKRRQTAETERDTIRAELDALKQQFQQLQQPTEPPAPPPSIWEDEPGAFQHFGQQIVGQATFNAKLGMSEMLASQAHDDFEPMRERFLQMMEANPALRQQALEAKHPWEKAYQIAKSAAQMEQLGAVDVADLEAKMREKIMAELQQGQSPVPQSPMAPPSLTGERNVGQRSGPAWGGSKPLEDLLPH